MNISQERWSKFKQELLTIIFISTIHIWWIFNFPAYMRLGSFYTNILGICMGIFGVILYAFIFSYPKKCVACLKFEQIDTELCGYTFKKVMRILIAAFVAILLLILWYKDFYRMPSIYYILLYIYYVTFFVLLFRAANRQPNTK